MKKQSNVHNSEELMNAYREVCTVPPNDLVYKPLTRVFKRTTRCLKVFPFAAIVPFAFVLTALTYLLYREKLIYLVSLLQYGL